MLEITTVEDIAALRESFDAGCKPVSWGELAIESTETELGKTQ